MPKVKVYYNSACPVCDAGIKDQRQRMEFCGTQVEWIDIHKDADAVCEISAEREFVRSDCTWSTGRASSRLAPMRLRFCGGIRPDGPVGPGHTATSPARSLEMAIQCFRGGLVCFESRPRALVSQPSREVM